MSLHVGVRPKIGASPTGVSMLASSNRVPVDLIGHGDFGFIRRAVLFRSGAVLLRKSISILQGIPWTGVSRIPRLTWNI